MQKVLICQSTMPDIDFSYKKLDKEEIELFVTLSLVTREKETGEELKDKFEEFVKVDPLTNLIYLRYKYFKDKLVLPEITPLVFNTIAILSGGNPGRAIMMLIDLCGTFKNKSIITSAEIVEKYPNGIYSDDTFMNICDYYVKTGKVLFSEMY